MRQERNVMPHIKSVAKKMVIKSKKQVFSEIIGNNTFFIQRRGV